MESQQGSSSNGDNLNVNDVDISDWLPDEYVKWVKMEATKLGVHDVYITYPLLVAVSYLSQHSEASYLIKNEAGDVINLHTEPLILYGLVCGDSGSNKSGAIKVIMDIVDSIYNVHGEVDHSLDTFSLDGLMGALIKNNGCAVGLYDELSTFNDSLDRGSNGSYERARFLTLFNAGKWQKNTKTSGDCRIRNPRFNMLAFTQPKYATKFSEENKDNGLFARFLLAIPPERPVFVGEKKRLLFSMPKVPNISQMISSIYERCTYGDKNCHGIQLVLSLTDGSAGIYDTHHDNVVKTKVGFTGIYKSSLCKSIGILLRLGGIMSLIRNSVNSVDNDEAPIYDNDIKLIDIKRAMNVLQYSLKTTSEFTSTDKNIVSVDSACGRLKEMSRRQKLPMPSPENFTLDYVLSFPRPTRRILLCKEKKLSEISRDKIYPPVPATDTRDGGAIARNFVQGLSVLGFGEVDVKGKMFKRYNPDDEDCPAVDDLRSVWKVLNILA